LKAVRPGRSARQTAVVLSVLFLAPGCDEAGPPPAPPAPSVTVVEVQPTQVPDRSEVAGRLQSVNTVDLRARVEGELVERNFTEGAEVEQGDLLLRIDPARYEAEVARLEAELARSRAAREKARRDLERVRNLFEQDVTSRAMLDRAEALAAEAEASARADEAALQKAKLDLEYTRIVAPVSGVIGRLEVDVGNLVGPDSGTLARITQLDPIFAVFSVSERTLARRNRRDREIRERTGEAPPAAVPRLRLSDGSVHPHAGVIDYIDPDVQVSTGTLEVRGTFPNPDHSLRPGQFATVLLEWPDPSERILLPRSAIQESQLGATVFVVDDESRAASRRVELGATRGRDVVIEEGLEPGERVVVNGLQKVRPGGPVTPVLASAPAGAGSGPPAEPVAEAPGAADRLD